MLLNCSLIHSRDKTKEPDGEIFNDIGDFHTLFRQGFAADVFEDSSYLKFCT